jgi:hypothetical protein
MMQEVMKQPIKQQLKAVSSVAEFLVIGEASRSSSGKTVKLHIFENGRCRFIGQITRAQLKSVLDGSSLKADITVYRNASRGAESDC